MSCWARQYETRMSSIKRSNHILSLAFILEDSWTLLFINGAVARDSRYAALGGVARDQEGKWIVGSFHFLGVCSPFEAEVWGILDGIFILLNKGYRQILILSDNLEVIQALSNLDLEDSGITLFRRIQCIMRAQEKWRIRHIPRHQNLVLDHLLKFSLNLKSNLHPKEIIDLLKVASNNGCIM
ncbi:hypothetical protein J1N35_026163 [Gossypium stocksii]|uniref:RNase H type-1 domain-containing protein n=1 Tax=Gossypium stocksii TaxID=47602 RepID=A0A9D3V893_9ROSI|nr:hypothetical protein J1N35_026163 [Gossypium stocksii]